jgi:transcriptional regulator with XRE-family HTH domain
MAYPAYVREKARELRIKKKLSLLEIAERLSLPKTTVFYWIRDLPDPEIKHRDTPGRSRARIAQGRRMKAEYQRRREEAYQRGWDEFALLAAQPTFTDFVCMYIGEGYKRDRNRVSISNSDPAVIKLADRWIRRLTSNEVTYLFQYHADQDPDELISFWSAGLRADKRLFRFQRKSNSGSLNGRGWRCPHGVLAVRCNDTYLRARLQAWMDRVRESWLDSTDTGRGAAW